MVEELGLQPVAAADQGIAADGFTEPDAASANEAAADADRAKWALIRIEYESGQGTQASICLKHGITQSQLNWRIKRDLWVRRYRSKVVDRAQIIVRMFRLLERQVMDFETEMNEMSRTERRSGEKEAALLGKLAGNLEKLAALDLRMTAKEPGRRQTRQMQDIRNKLIERIEQLKRD